MIYLIVTLFLQIIFNNLYMGIDGFIPMLFLVSIFFLFFIISKRIMIFIILIYGIIFDILYSNIFLLNTLLLFFVYFMFFLYYKRYCLKISNFIFLSLLLFYIYTVLACCFEIIKFNNIYIYIIVNFLYFLISFIVLKSRIFGRKVKINYK